MAQLHDLDMSDAGELREGFEPFPPGEYELYLEESERKSTKANDGEYLNCTFVVKNGEFANRKIFHMFNLWNKSPDSVKGAKADWRALCEATTGQPNAPGGDSSNLHYKPFIGTVAIEPATIENINGVNVVKYPAKNKMVFRKGTIRSLAEQGSAPIGVVAGMARATELATNAMNSAAVPVTQSTPASTVAARPTWAKR